MLCYLQSPKHGTRQLVVFIVEEGGRTTLKLGALLGIESAIPERNMAIMRSIVEVPKKSQSGGRVGTRRKGNKKQGHRRPKPRKPLTK